MLPHLKNLLKLVAFWLIVFAINRLAFQLALYTKFSDCSFTELLLTYYHGLALDISTTGYIMALPLIGWFIFLIYPFKGFNKAISIYIYLILFLLSFISIVDFNIYREWGTKFNYRALYFAINSPGEALASSSSSPLFQLFIFFIVQFWGGIFLYKKYFNSNFESVKGQIIYKIILIPTIVFVSFLAIRGGFGVAVINESAAYFSDKKILNHSAINTSWSLVHSITETKEMQANPYSYFSNEDANNKVQQLYSCTDSSNIKLFNSERPNIVFILLESYTADVIQSLGGEKDVAPHLEELIKEGILFENIYSSGDRTDKGLVAILSAFPSQGIASVMTQSEKAEQLPSITAELLKNGYKSASFYYGGESEFANMKSYLLNLGFNTIISKHDFAKKDMNSKWGAHDGVVLQKQVKDLSSYNEPFISSLLTLSNHEPFEVPIASKFKGNDLSDKFRNSAFYTDSMLKNYFDAARMEPWFNNTLFVLVADHGHRMPKDYADLSNPGKFKIPLIFYGNVIKKEFKGSKIKTIGSQTDIASTLMHQLNITTTEFKWSKNLLSNCPGFAFYSFDNGFGWVNTSGKVVFDNPSKKLNSSSKGMNTASIDSSITIGKAYMQAVLDEYISY